MKGAEAGESMSDACGISKSFTMIEFNGAVPLLSFKPASMKARPRQRATPLVMASIAGVLLSILAGPCRAQDVSAWDKDLQSAMRLISGTNVKESAPLRAGIELRLEPGWDTYWRYPGDSGVPPIFDFTGSDNVKSVTVLWPAPQRFPDGAGGNSIGYLRGVIFPLRVTPQEPAKPVTLKAKASYAVCEKLCVPAEGKAELELTPGPASEDKALAAAEARVPKSVALGAPGAMAIRSLHRDVANGRPRVVVDITAPDGVAIDLFAEGPTPDWALPLPQPVAGGPPGTRRFAFDIDGIPPGAKIEGALLTLTATDGEKAIEVKAPLD
jgi:DsbC/DsbD-like thiol-disulfide interchange protein